MDPGRLVSSCTLSVFLSSVSTYSDILWYNFLYFFLCAIYYKTTHIKFYCQYNLLTIVRFHSIHPFIHSFIRISFETHAFLCVWFGFNSICFEFSMFNVGIRHTKQITNLINIKGKEGRTGRTEVRTIIIIIPQFRCHTFSLWWKFNWVSIL